MLDFISKLFKPKPPLRPEKEASYRDNVRHEFESMKLSLKEDKYFKTIEKRYKEVESQVKIRKSKGIPSDPKLDLAYDIYKNEYERLKVTNVVIK